MKFFSSVKNRIISVALITVLVVASIFAFTNFFTNAEVYYNIPDYGAILSAQNTGDEYYNFVSKDLDSEVGTSNNPFTVLEIVPEKCMGMMGYYIPGCEPFSAEYLNTNYPNPSDKSKGYLSQDNDLVKGNVYEKKTITVKNAAGQTYKTYPDTQYNNMDTLVTKIFGRSSYGNEGDKVNIPGLGEVDGGFRSQVITISPEEMYDENGNFDTQYLKLVQQADFIVVNQQVESQNKNLVDLYVNIYNQIYNNTYHPTDADKKFSADTATKHNDIPWQMVKEIFYRQAGMYGRKAATILDMDFKGYPSLNCGALYYLLMLDTPENTANKFLNGEYNFTLDSLEGSTWSNGGDYNNGVTVKATKNGTERILRYVKKANDSDPIDRTDKFFGDGKSVCDHTMVIGGNGNFLTENYVGDQYNPRRIQWYIDKSLADEMKKSPNGELVKDVDFSNFDEHNRTANLNLVTTMRYVYGKVTNYKQVLKILEIEPTLTWTNNGKTESTFRVSEGKYDLVKNWVKEWFDGKYEITNMTFAEFNTIKADLQSEYDIILIGTRGMTDINPNGKATDGNYITFPDRTGDTWNGYNKYLLTCKRYLDLLSFSRVGAVVFLDTAYAKWSGCNYKYNDTGELCNLSYYERLWCRYRGGGRNADPTLMITATSFLDNDTYPANGDTVGAKTKLKNQISQVMIKAKGVTGNMPEEYTGLGSKYNTGGKNYATGLKETSGSAIKTTDKQLVYKISVQGYKPGTYEFKLYADTDGDDNFQGSTAKQAYLDNARYGTVNASHRYLDNKVDFTLYAKSGDGEWMPMPGKTVTVNAPAVINGKQQKAATVQYMLVSEEIDTVGYLPWQIELVRTGTEDKVNPILVNDYWKDENGNKVFPDPNAEGALILGNIRSVINGATWMKGDVEEINVLQIDTDPNSTGVHYNSKDMLFTEDEVKNKYKINYDYVTDPSKVNMFDYDVVVIGASSLDGGQKIIGYDKYKAFETDLMKYIQSGKGIVFTQNALNESHDAEYAGRLITDAAAKQTAINDEKNKIERRTSAAGYRYNVYTGQSEVRPYLNISNFIVDDYYTQSQGTSIHFNNKGGVTTYPYNLNDNEVSIGGVTYSGINVGTAATQKFAVKIDLPNYVNNEVEVCDSDTYGTVMNDAFITRGGDGSNLSYLMSACNTYYIGLNTANIKANPYDVSDAEKLFVNTLIAAYRQGKDVKMQCHNLDLAVDNVNCTAKGYLELYELYGDAIKDTALEVAPNTSEITNGGINIKMSVWIGTDKVGAEERYEIAFLEYLNARGNIQETGSAGNASQLATNKFEYRRLMDGVNEGVPYAIGEGKTVDMTYTDLVAANRTEYDEELKRTKVGELSFNISRQMIEDCEGVFKLQLRPYVESGWYWKPHEALGVANYEIDILEMLMFNLN